MLASRECKSESQHESPSTASTQGTRVMSTLVLPLRTRPDVDTARPFICTAGATDLISRRGLPVARYTPAEKDAPPTRVGGRFSLGADSSTWISPAAPLVEHGPTLTGHGRAGEALSSTHGQRHHSARPSPFLAGRDLDPG